MTAALSRPAPLRVPMPAVASQLNRAPVPTPAAGPLLAGSVPQGFHYVPDAAPTGHECRDGFRARVCGRWLAPVTASAAEPLAIDVAVSAFDGRTAALRALTTGARAAEGRRAAGAATAMLGQDRDPRERPLFPPRIGDDAAARRTDFESGHDHYVIYRIDVRAGRHVATVAAAWQWPAGSPAWLYERARELVALMRAGRCLPCEQPN